MLNIFKDAKKPLDDIVRFSSLDGVVTHPALLEKENAGLRSYCMQHSCFPIKDGEKMRMVYASFTPDMEVLIKADGKEWKASLGLTSEEEIAARLVPEWDKWITTKPEKVEFFSSLDGVVTHPALHAPENDVLRMSCMENTQLPVLTSGGKMRMICPPGEHHNHGLLVGGMANLTKDKECEIVFGVADKKEICKRLFDELRPWVLAESDTLSHIETLNKEKNHD